MEEQQQAKPRGRYFAWTLDKALKRFQPKLSSKQRREFFFRLNSENNLTEDAVFSKFVVEYPSEIRSLQQEWGLRLLVVRNN